MMAQAGFGVQPIIDPEVTECLHHLNFNIGDSKKCVSGYEFIEKALQWWVGSKSNSINGLEFFKHRHLTHGSVQAFDSFYVRHKQRRFRIFPGEFTYHKVCFEAGFRYQLLDLQLPQLEEGDAFIISFPFSDSGSQHPLMEAVLRQAESLRVPVLVDLAYLNLAANMHIELDRPCIDMVTFSLSKAFYPLEKMRLGIRLMKQEWDDGINFFNQHNMVNHHSLQIATHLIQTFPVDHTYAKYRKKQEKFCNEMQLTVSDTVLFGLGGKGYEKYNRGNEWNRICLSGLYENK